MQPLMVFFWRSSCGWMKCPQIRACSGSGVAETKSRRKRDRAAGARGQGAEPDQASCVRDFPNASHRLIPCFVEGASPPSPGVRARSKATPGSGVFSAQRRELPGQLFESPSPPQLSGIPLGRRRAKPRVRVIPGTVSLEATTGGRRGLKNTRRSTRVRESDLSARSLT